MLKRGVKYKNQYATREGELVKLRETDADTLAQIIAVHTMPPGFWEGYLEVQEECFVIGIKPVSHDQLFLNCGA